MKLDFTPNLQRTWVAIGVSAIGAGTKIYSGFKQNSLANKINPQFDQYQTSPYAKQQLGTAQQAYNAPMPGYQDQVRGIQTAQSNANSFVQKNATDSGQALSLGGLNQGIANNAVTDLGRQQAQYKMGMLGNLNNAYGAMIGEGDKEYNSQFQKYQTDVGIQQGLRSGGMQNISSGINDIASGIATGQQSQQQDDFYNKLLAMYANK